MNEKTFLIIIGILVAVVIIGVSALLIKNIVDEINFACAKTNETVQTRYGKINCLDWNSKNMTFLQHKRIFW